MERHQLDLSELTTRLRGNHRRVTEPRQLILNLLRHEKHPCSAREIHEKLSNLCNLATVYRSLHLLESMRMVTKKRNCIITPLYRNVLDVKEVMPSGK